MSEIASLEPRIIWSHFVGICQVPRPSKKETAIIQYLIDFAQKRKLEHKLDKTGNLLIKKAATKGKENSPIVILQSHVDMVCEKNSATQHDFNKDPILPYIEGSWVKAKGTTLGADNGIGVASMLAVLDAEDIVHGPVECLFTVDEETGLTGAFGLEKGFFEGKILLNLDSEDEGTIFIGCAGGMTTTAQIPFSFEPLNSSFQTFRLEVKGLQGGHSGDDINKALGNAVKVLARLLFVLNKKVDFQLLDLTGGNLHNAIAREAFAVIAFSKENKELAYKVIIDESEAIKKELQFKEKNIEVEFNESITKQEALQDQLKNKIIRLLYGMPHGVISMSRAIPGLVETSTNLASIKRKEHYFEVVTSQRSDSNTRKKDIGNCVMATFHLAGIEAKQSEGYPGWKPNKNSPILKTTVESYKRLFKKEPIVTAIHAGLECGLFLDKYPGLDMVSFGPTIKGAHSPDERVEIETVEKFWVHLKDVLQSLSFS